MGQRRRLGGWLNVLLMDASAAGLQKNLNPPDQVGINSGASNSYFA